MESCDPESTTLDVGPLLEMPLQSLEELVYSLHVAAPGAFSILRFVAVTLICDGGGTPTISKRRMVQRGVDLLDIMARVRSGGLIDPSLT
jgi:hypothetical protein